MESQMHRAKQVSVVLCNAATSELASMDPIPCSQRRTSLADFQETFGATFVCVSLPEYSTDASGSFAESREGGYTAPVMRICEDLTKHLKEGVSFFNLVDFAGSSSIDLCNLRSHSIDEGRRNSAHGIEHSTWLAFWRGKIAGGMVSAFTAQPDHPIKADQQLGAQGPFWRPMVLPTVRVLVALSVDGGPVSQVEKLEIPKLLRSVTSDLNRRAYQWSASCHIIWAHFPHIDGLVASLNGERNLTFDMDDARCVRTDHSLLPTTFKYDEDLLRENAASLLAISPQDVYGIIKSGVGFDLDYVFACCRDGDADGVSYALAKKPEVLEAVNEWQKTPLMVAATWGSADVIRVLLEAKADVTRMQGAGPKLDLQPGATALSYGVYGRGCNPESLELLLQAGADPALPMHEKNEKTPLEFVLAKQAEIQRKGVEYWKKELRVPELIEKSERSRSGVIELLERFERDHRTW
eukprot:TRINITY_DN786_c0_g3_i1.p1 TRINITY_DN786_c0_g3~~TRINITY_DN786_c0_g3_i1.p1  ORF type:complete len:466 (-),score=48.27 TRINITY_DN786_c0_g3_i1:455-1852(-)